MGIWRVTGSTQLHNLAAVEPSPHQLKKGGYLGPRHRVSPSPRETKTKVNVDQDSGGSEYTANPFDHFKSIAVDHCCRKQK
eukprot:804591-Pelagomonas_calceolata.AAC.1